MNGGEKGLLSGRMSQRQSLCLRVIINQDYLQIWGFMIYVLLSLEKLKHKWQKIMEFTVFVIGIIGLQVSRF